MRTPVENVSLLQKQIVISNSVISSSKVYELIDLFREKQDSGVVWKMNLLAKKKIEDSMRSNTNRLHAFLLGQGPVLIVVFV